MSRNLNRRDFLFASFSAATSIAVLNMPTLAIASESAEEESLSQEAIRARIQVINEKYSVGELLSDEDASFI